MSIWSIFLLPSDSDELDNLSADLWDLGTIGIEEVGGGICAYFDASVDPAVIQNRFPSSQSEVKEHIAPLRIPDPTKCEPILVGKRFAVLPVHMAANQSNIPPHRIVLPVDAGMAFGSGRHESTQLCIEALELLVKPNQTVFDVGCGSGILALAAASLGAGLVVASDIDESAIHVASRHFPGPTFVGSADCFPASQADLVLCNIAGKVNDRLAFDLRRILKPDGLLILSGFTHETRPSNFCSQEVLCLGGWECWICKPQSIQVPHPTGDANVHEPHWWL